MDFTNDLIERIRKQIGLELASDEAFTMLQPVGNEHSVQFFLKNLSDEYLEFEIWDKHHLYLCDVTSTLDFEFILDDDGRFAVLQQNKSGQSKPVEAVMDLRDDYLVTVYYFGDAKTASRINQQLIATEKIFPCYVGASILEQLICELETITRIEFDFEQQPSTFLEPVILKGTVSGLPAQTIYGQYQQNYKSYFNVKCICGHLTDDAQGNLMFHASGLIQVDDCRLADFMSIVKQLYLQLRVKYQNLVEKCLIQWESSDNNKYTQLKGNVIEIWLGQPVDKLDGLLRYLTRGDRSMQLFGVSERVSRKLWSVKSIHIKSGARIEFEASATMLRIYLTQRKAIPILDGIEGFLEKHVSTDFENLDY